MTVCDLKNGNEKSSASCPTAFLVFCYQIQKFQVSMWFYLMTCTFQKIIADHPEVPAMVKVKVFNVRFVMPQEITLKIFPIFRSHTWRNSLKNLTELRLIRLLIISTIRASKKGIRRIRQVCRRFLRNEDFSVSSSAKGQCFNSRNLSSCLLLSL